jgi:hypothetical protein
MLSSPEQRDAFEELSTSFFFARTARPTSARFSQEGQ